MKRSWAVLLLVLAVAGTVFTWRNFSSGEKSVPATVPLHPVVEKIQEPLDARSEISGRYYGLCKRNSIATVEDFRRTVRNDPVLAAHFADFNWESATLGRQERAVWTYVSYRKDGIVRMTTKPVRLPKGDGYITDGNHVVRTYCCNDYVAAPPPDEVAMAAPAAPVERVDAPPRRTPRADEASPHESPPWSPVDNSPAEVAKAFENGPGHHSSYPYPPVYPGGGDPTQHSYSSPTKHPPPVVIPEPGTLSMVGMAAAVFGLFHLIRRRRGASR